jgi:hypothetical protein
MIPGAPAQLRKRDAQSEPHRALPSARATPSIP